MSEHPSPHLLEDLVNGALEAAEAETVLGHLDDCEVCQDRVEALWPEVGLRHATVAVPSMTSETSSEIEDRLLRRIRAATVGNEIAWLVTSGFLGAVCFLLRPLVAFDTVRESTGGTTR